MKTSKRTSTKTATASARKPQHKAPTQPEEPRTIICLTPEQVAAKIKMIDMEALQRAAKVLRDTAEMDEGSNTAEGVWSKENEWLRRECEQLRGTARHLESMHRRMRIG